MTSVLAGSALFRGIPEKSIRDLEARGVMEEPKDGAKIFAQGDTSSSVYMIVGGSGNVRVGAADQNGKILMVEVFGPGDIFGEMGVIDGGPRSAEAIAQGRVKLLRIPGPVFLEALGQLPMLGANLSLVLVRRVRRTFELFQDATFETLEVRLARQILYLSALSGTRTELGIRLAGRFRQSDLADLLGATPRTIITILNAWRASGLVRYDAQRGTLTIADKEGIDTLANGARTRG